MRISFHYFIDLPNQIVNLTIKVVSIKKKIKDADFKKVSKILYMFNA